MPRYQELCRVRICWLDAGDVCLLSQLGLSEYSERNAIVQYEGVAGGIYEPLDEEAILGLMLCQGRGVSLNSSFSSGNPLVRVLAPVTSYEFDALNSTGSWLMREAMDVGFAAMFDAYLPEFLNIGYYLWNEGQHVDEGPWGVSVCFNTLWALECDSKGGKSRLQKQFGGLVDLARIPLGMFSERPALQQRPVRNRVHSGGIPARRQEN